MNVPSDARVYVNGVKTKSVGSERSYVSRGLQSGFNYSYEVRAEVDRDGKAVEETKMVSLTAGRTSRVVFALEAGSFDAEAFFAERDADPDGKLTGEEISERMRERLDEIDTDKDGAVSKDEFQAPATNAQNASIELADAQRKLTLDHELTDRTKETPNIEDRRAAFHNVRPAIERTPSHSICVDGLNRATARVTIVKVTALIPNEGVGLEFANAQLNNVRNP